MTLFKQIAILVSVTFFLLASIILINDFRRTGTFLQGQLQTTAQDMTTSLGIAISNLPEGDDPATLEVLFNSVFDSGYYSRIQLIDSNGKVIHQKSQSIKLDDVPDWFFQLVPLSQAEGSTIVMKGWTQLGELKLSLHPGFAYSGLYNTLISTLQWFVILLVIVILGLWLVLHYLLLPLQRVREQADAIHKNQFVQQSKLPTTVELKRVVEAMNRMVAKVQGVFDDQEKTLARYQELLYQDKLTGLGNRRYMLDQLQQSLSEGSSFHGCLGIIKINNFDQLRERLGYEMSDKLIKAMAELVVCKHASFEAEKTARLSDDEFAFLISADENSAVAFVEGLYQLFQSNDDLNEIFPDLYLVAGISNLATGSDLGALLSEIDYSLTQAVDDGPYSIRKNTSSDLSLPKGKMQWRAWLEDIIHSKRLFLVGQLAMDNKVQKMQKELFIRTRNQQDQVIPASAFMPMASSLGMALEIDQAVFRLIRDNTGLDHSVPLAINLSAAFFERADAHEEFNQLLDDCQNKATKLCIEASHHILLQHPVMCTQVSDRVRRHGHQFGIDNLDLGQSLQLLQSAEFDYVKINAATLREISNSDMSASFQALKTMTDTLDVKIIAVGVDSQTLFDDLQAMGIEIMQGNFINEPEAV